MSNVERRLRILRGNKSDMPTLLSGEFGFAEDEKQLYVGTIAGNILPNEKKFNEIDESIEQANTEINKKSDKTYVDTELGKKLNLSGGVMTGNLEVPTINGTKIQTHRNAIELDNLMRVGAFGWGAETSPQLGVHPDLIKHTSITMFQSSEATTYGLPGERGGVLFTKAWRPNQHTTQEYNTVVGTSRTFIRTASDTMVWTPWIEIYNSRNADVIVEKGSNSNGEFIRFSDGTQICRRIVTMNLVDIPIGVSNVSYTFPAAFFNGDNQYAINVSTGSSVTSVATAVRLVNGPSFSLSQWLNIFLEKHQNIGDNQITRLTLVAIGRWK